MSSSSREQRRPDASNGLFRPPNAVNSYFNDYFFKSGLKEGVSHVENNAWQYSDLERTLGNGWPGDKRTGVDSSDPNKHFTCGYSKLAIQIHEMSLFAQRSAYQRFPMKQRLRAELAGIITQELGIPADIYIVGSTLNGLCSGERDLDLCVIPKRPIDSNYQKIQLLTRIRDELDESEAYDKFEIRQAAVPLLRFRARKNCMEGLNSQVCIDVDLTIGSADSIRNTHLIRNYARLDDRVRQLIIAVRRWAMKYEINDASQGGLSSLSLALMVIHYLQFGCKPAVLPCLNKALPNLFNSQSKVEKLSLSEPKLAYSSRNKQPVDELLIGFFNYFDEFVFCSNKIDVANGNVLKVARHSLQGIVILGPFKGKSISSTTENFKNFCKINEAIEDASSKLKNTRNLYSICLNICYPMTCQLVIIPEELS